MIQAIPQHSMPSGPLNIVHWVGGNAMAPTIVPCCGVHSCCNVVCTHDFPPRTQAVSDRGAQLSRRCARRPARRRRARSGRAAPRRLSARRPSSALSAEESPAAPSTAPRQSMRVRLVCSASDDGSCVPHADRCAWHVATEQHSAKICVYTLADCPQVSLPERMSRLIMGSGPWPVVCGCLSC